MDELLAVLKREAAARGIEITGLLPDGRVTAQYGDTLYEIGLANIERQFAQDRDPSIIARFLDTIVAADEGVPSWETARTGLRTVVESALVEVGDTLAFEVSDDVVGLLAYVDPEESRITFVTPDVLETWGITPNEAVTIAQENMERLLEDAPLHIEDIDGARLAMFSSTSPFKASLILCPNLAEVLAPILGWPLFAVIPCRDFVYMFADEKLIPVLGSTVVNEYKNSAYPISAEVFSLTDEGIEAIGTYPVE